MARTKHTGKGDPTKPATKTPYKNRASLLKEVTTLHKEISKRDNQIAVLGDKVEELDAKLGKSERKCDDLGIQLASKKHQIEQHVSELQRLNEEMTSLEQKINVLEATENDLRKAMSAIKDRAARSEGRAEGALSAMTALGTGLRE